MGDTQLPGNVAPAGRRIVSALPGRIRLRDRGLRNGARLKALEARVGAWPGVLRLEANVRTGSLLVGFDPQLIGMDELEARLEAAADRVMAAPRPTGPGSRRVVNRYAKLGMLGSLAASLGLLVAGLKRGHGVAGALFLVGLSVHLGVHRKSLLR